jgi:integrase
MHNLTSSPQIDFAQGRWSPSTQAVYGLCWRDWERWCARREVSSFPSDPEDIAAFMTERANTLSWSSVSGRLQAILAINELHGNEIKVKQTGIRDAAADIRRRIGTAHTPKKALPAEAIKRIVASMPEDLVQERALLLFGFKTAMRRSEIAALNVDDLAWPEDGCLVTIRHSKTDKVGKGEVIPIGRDGGDFCAVDALKLWLGDRQTGPVFLGKTGKRITGYRIALLTKRWAGKHGFNPREIGAHSLRRGCITTMHEGKIDMVSGMKISRHKTPAIYLGYVQAKAALENPALAALKIV